MSKYLLGSKLLGSNWDQVPNFSQNHSNEKKLAFSMGSENCREWAVSLPFSSIVLLGVCFTSISLDTSAVSPEITSYIILKQQRKERLTTN